MHGVLGDLMPQWTAALAVSRNNLRLPIVNCPEQILSLDSGHVVDKLRMPEAGRRANGSFNGPLGRV